MVTPVAETDPVGGFGDAADDPAIWVDPNDPSNSVILGTDKTPNGGLYLYDLEGHELQFVRRGSLNNVDLRSGFALDGAEVALVAATLTGDDELVLFALDPETRTLAEVGAAPIPTSPAAYGTCMYHSPLDGEYYAFVDTEFGAVQQFRLAADGDAVTAELVREFCVPSQPEGCAVDDERGFLYLGEEGYGVWKFAAEPDGAAPGSELPACEGAIPGALVDTVTNLGGRLVRDVEGIAVTNTGPNAGYLLVSTQGASTYAIYDRDGDNAFVAEFAVWGGGDACIDGAGNTDGIDAVGDDLGPAFPGGLMVVQDGENGDPASTQNFKYLRLDHVLEDVFVEGPSCVLADYGGTASILPPGPERTPAFCEAFCAKCEACYAEDDPAFAEGDCHYLSPKPVFELEDCLLGCNGGFIPATTSPLQDGWEELPCLQFDDNL